MSRRFSELYLSRFAIATTNTEHIFKTLLDKSTEIFGFANTFRPLTITLIIAGYWLTGYPRLFYLVILIAHATMTTSDVDQLIDMGFDRDRAQLAVSKTGGRTYLYRDILFYRLTDICPL